MIYEKINDDIKFHMKSKSDVAIISFLRYLISEINNFSMNSKRVIDYDLCLKVLNIELTKIKLELKNTITVNGDITKLTFQKNYVEGLLPKKDYLSEEETEKLVDEVIKDLKISSIKENGKVMKEIKTRSDKLDMKLVSEIVKQKMS